MVTAVTVLTVTVTAMVTATATMRVWMTASCYTINII
jgi:hypothetical protein